MRWTDDQLTVLFAIFVSQPFKVGDDAHPECAHIAKVFGRTPGAIDRQWRNVKHHLFRLDLYGVHDNVGDNVKDVVDEYRTDLSRLRRDALEIIDEKSWNLGDMIQDIS